MTLIQTAELSQTSPLLPNEQHQVYCGLDAAVTLEVREEIGREFSQPPQIYAFERALQGPYLEIMQRGFAVDQVARAQATSELRGRLETLSKILGQLADAAWGRPLNPNSGDQLKDLFYSEMKIPEIWISQKGQRKLAMNREVLEKLDTYLYARPIVSVVLAIRDLAKQLQRFESEIDPDGRFRASYNIAGTTTGRPSSSKNAFGTGDNAQNLAPSLRYVFVADRGWKIGQVDLEQVEARDVGWFCGCLQGDWSYLEACEQGDLHTNNAKRIWPELPWTGSPRSDREVSDRQFYREFSYRDMAKRGSHLSNYMGTAWTASRALKIPLGIMEEFQARYIRGRPSAYDKSSGRFLDRIEPAFPCIPRFWQWVAQELQTKHQLVTPFGRRRHFFGRPGDDTTLREAIAFLPQSTTADRMNLGLWRVWRHMPQIQLLAQGYDSITFQYRESADETAVIGEVLERIKVELRENGGRRYVVPGEAKVGWNWGAQVLQADVDRALAARRRPPRLNPDGLLKWKPGDDKRIRSPLPQRVVM